MEFERDSPYWDAIVGEHWPEISPARWSGLADDAQDGAAALDVLAPEQARQAFAEVARSGATVRAIKDEFAAQSGDPAAFVEALRSAANTFREFSDRVRRTRNRILDIVAEATPRIRAAAQPAQSGSGDTDTDTDPAVEAARARARVAQLIVAARREVEQATREALAAISPTGMPSLGDVATELRRAGPWDPPAVPSPGHLPVRPDLPPVVAGVGDDTEFDRPGQLADGLIDFIDSLVPDAAEPDSIERGIPFDEMPPGAADAQSPVLPRGFAGTPGMAPHPSAPVGGYAGSTPPSSQSDAVAEQPHTPIGRDPLTDPGAESAAATTHRQSSGAQPDDGRDPDPDSDQHSDSSSGPDADHAENRDGAPTTAGADTGSAANRSVGPAPQTAVEAPMAGPVGFVPPMVSGVDGRGAAAASGAATPGGNARPSAGTAGAGASAQARTASEGKPPAVPRVTAALDNAAPGAKGTATAASGSSAQKSRAREIGVVADVNESADDENGSSNADPVREAVGAAMAAAAVPSFVVGGERVDGDLVLARTILGGIVAAVGPTVVGVSWAVAILRHPDGLGAFVTSNEGRGWLPSGLYLPKEISTPWVWQVAEDAAWEGIADPARVLIEFGIVWGSRRGARITAVVSSGPIDSAVARQLSSVAMEGEVGSSAAMDLGTKGSGRVDRLALIAEPRLLDQVNRIPEAGVAGRVVGLAADAHARVGKTRGGAAESLHAPQARERIIGAVRDRRAVPQDWWDELRDIDDLLAASMLGQRTDASRIALGDLRFDGTQTRAEGAALRAIVFERRCNELTLLLANEPDHQTLRDAVYAYGQIIDHPLFDGAASDSTRPMKQQGDQRRPKVTVRPDR